MCKEVALLSAHKVYKQCSPALESSGRWPRVILRWATQQACCVRTLYQPAQRTCRNSVRLRGLGKQPNSDQRKRLLLARSDVANRSASVLLTGVRLLSFPQANGHVSFGLPGINLVGRGSVCSCSCGVRALRWNPTIRLHRADPSQHVAIIRFCEPFGFASQNISITRRAFAVGAGSGCDSRVLPKKDPSFVSYNMGMCREPGGSLPSALGKFQFTSWISMAPRKVIMARIALVTHQTWNYEGCFENCFDPERIGTYPSYQTMGLTA